MPDENRHFFRAVAVSQLQFLPLQGPNHTAVARIPASVIDLAARQGRGDYIPSARQPYSWDIAKTYLHQPLKAKDQQTAYLGSIGTYSMVGYVPAATAITFGRLVNAPPLALLYLARLANVAVWLALGYLAIKLMPRAKWQLLALLLLPMAVFEAASVSIDGLLIGLAAVLVGLILRAALSRQTLSLSDRRLLLAVGFGLAAVKPTYVIMAFAPLALGIKLFGGKAERNKFVGQLAACTLLPLVLWQLAVIGKTNITYGIGILAQPKAQLLFMITHPWHDLVTFFKTFFMSGGDWMWVSFAGSFGWLEYRLALWAVALVFVGVALSLAWPSATDKPETTGLNRFLLAALLAATGLGIATVMYLTYSPVGADVISGIQGRYLLPLLPFALLLRRLPTPTFKLGSLMITGVLLTATVATVISFNY